MRPAERVDLPAFAAAFGRAMHDAGIPSTPERAVRFAQSLALAPPHTRALLYWTARAVFVSSHEQIALFDRVFAAVFDGLAGLGEPRGDPNAPPLPRGGVEAGPRPAPPDAALVGGDAGSVVPRLTELGAREGDESDDGDPCDLPIALASSAERLADRNFRELHPDELRALRRLMSELSLAPPPRLVRRSRRDRHGNRLDVRATLRESRRTGGDPARRIMRRRLLRPRKLVVLCDISGSMDPYARAFLQFLHAAVGGPDAEAFVFATRLTRLTRALRGRQPDLALERAAEAAPDWSGGTRIGRAIETFNDDYGRRGMARGAVVVIVSDGWEREDPALVAREMERLRRLAFRIVWVNPRKASPGYAPLAGGMAAALPFCDAFVSGHDLHALSAVTDAIGTPHQPRRRRR